ncbi:MAG TPA: energy-coupling factor transporter ATPase [Clostridiales bacterium]|nr:energy-coupling factor transporter ATPase [Clostridiales bacterium]
MALELQNVSHTYQPNTPFSAVALDNISLSIEDRDLLALIGHTGSGKSTLAQHLNGLMKPTSGRVLFNGKDINEDASRLRELRFQVGLVFQYPEYQLFEETVEKDIAFGPRNMGLSDEEIKSRVLGAMDLVGLNPEEIGQKSPFELSGGQMRRVALAGVLAMRPKVLVLDEPTAGLDPRARSFLLSDIKRLHREGTTVVMISHSMDDVAALATRIAVMDHGSLAMTGTPAEIFAQPQRLIQMGLNVPQVSLLAGRLIAAGLPVKPCFRMEEMADQLAELLKGGDGDVA